MRRRSGHTPHRHRPHPSHHRSHRQSPSARRRRRRRSAAQGGRRPAAAPARGRPGGGGAAQRARRRDRLWPRIFSATSRRPAPCGAAQRARGVRRVAAIDMLTRKPKPSRDTADADAAEPPTGRFKGAAFVDLWTRPPRRRRWRWARSPCAARRPCCDRRRRRLARAARPAPAAGAPRPVFVSGLPLDASRAQIREAFGGCGEIAHCCRPRRASGPEPLWTSATAPARRWR